MMYLAFDTETNGLPLDPGSKDFYDTSNWPRVYQIGAILFDEMGFEYGRMNEIIRPDGWTIPVVSDFLLEMGEKDFFKDIGISTEYLMDVGKPMHKVLPQFIEMANSAQEMVAHNDSFDSPVLMCEFFRLRHFPQSWMQKPHNCTKLLMEKVCKIPGYKGKYKWPTLQEAYRHLFGREFDGAHDAMSDVQATMEVFLEYLTLDENLKR